MTHITPEQLAEWCKEALAKTHPPFPETSRLLSLIAALKQSQADLKEAREALKPFASISDETHCNDGLSLKNAADWALACGINLKVSDLRRAAKSGGVK